MLYVEIDQATAPEGSQVQARVLNSYGAVMAEAKTQGQRLQIPLAHASGGIHFVHIQKGIHGVTEKIFIH